MERGVWGLILVLSLMPWPLLRAKNTRDAAARASYEAAAKAEEDSVAQALESELNSMKPDTPLRDWLVLPEGDGPHPLLLWVHGGPLGSWNGWAWRWCPWLMAARGYAVDSAGSGSSTA